MACLVSSRCLIRLAVALAAGGLLAVSAPPASAKSRVKRGSAESVVSATTGEEDAGGGKKKKGRRGQHDPADRDDDQESESKAPTKKSKAARSGKSSKTTRAVGLEGTKRITKLAHVEIRARDMRLTDEAREKLERIAERYHTAVARPLVVTGGTRSIKRQAELMIAKLEHGDDIVDLYENHAAASEVADAFHDAQKGARRRKRGTIERVVEVLEAQASRGVFVSRHLLSGAVDVRSRGLDEGHVRALKAAVAAEPDVTFLDEREGAEPHFHLSL